MIDLLKLRVRFLIITEDLSVWRSFRALVLNHASDLGRHFTSFRSAPGFHLMLFQSIVRCAKRSDVEHFAATRSAKRNQKEKRVQNDPTLNASP